MSKEMTEMVLQECPDGVVCDFASHKATLQVRSPTGEIVFSSCRADLIEVAALIWHKIPARERPPRPSPPPEEVPTA